MSRTVGSAVVGALVLLGGCAAAQGPWRDQDERTARELALSEPGRICQVRVENGGEVYVDAGYRSGPTSMRLGRIEPGAAIEFGVPCSNGTVSAFHYNPELVASTIDRSRPKQLDPLEVTVLYLRRSREPSSP